MQVKTYRRWPCRNYALLVPAYLILLALSGSAADAPPNLIFILADDK